MRSSPVGFELDAELFSHRRQQRLVPRLEVAVEVLLGVAFAAGVDPLRAFFRQQFVELARDRLVGRGPVTIAATEHGVAHAFQRSWLGLAQALDESAGIVRRPAIVGGTDDRHRALGRELARLIVEAGQSRGEALRLARLGN